ncbi:MAG: nicotinate phosphoribosyltransferase [Clostridia bacterium]|nr:nicotinate phosphoribosyltransferase [Clostridia bacterium]
MDTQKLSMISDFYEFIMGRGYFCSQKADRYAYFDLYFRRVPDGGGYAVAAGLEQVCEYIDSMRFDADDLDFLRERGIDDEDFLRYLSHFRFTGDIFAVPEGTVVFPNEPILTVRAPMIEAQLIETALLLMINHQSLIATKASRMSYAARGKPVLELGARRAHGADAALLGARAAYIGGSHATSCTLAAKLYGIPSVGTMAHSWIQMFDCEYEAFCAHLRQNPYNATLLVDTYDTLGSGMPAACEAIRDVLLPRGITKASVRLDSGDIEYLSKKARAMLDLSGLAECGITVSNSLDEYKISRLCAERAPIDSFGAGESLITSKSSPVFGGVYKLAAVEDGGVILPKIKLSESVSKISVPGVKKLLRFYDTDGKAVADEILLSDEPIPYGSHTIFDPEATWKTKTLVNYSVRELLVPIYLGGERIYELPDVGSIKSYCEREKATLWSEIRRLESPHIYYVDLSERLWTLKRRMTGQRRSEFFLR